VAINGKCSARCIDAKLVKRITTERTLADLKNDLAEIAY